MAFATPRNKPRPNIPHLDRYERIAPLYDLLDLPFEYSRYRKLRPLLFQGLKGRVLDAGIGTDRNIQFYPPGAQVVGIDISPAMLARAERKRLSLGADVELHQRDVTHLAFEDQSFDAAVATFCSVFYPMIYRSRLCASLAVWSSLAGQSDSQIKTLSVGRGRNSCFAVVANYSQ